MPVQIWTGKTMKLPIYNRWGQLKLPGTVLVGLCGILTSTVTFANETNPDKKATHAQNYTVAIYYWPNFHADSFHQSKKGKDWTEWEVVKNGVPKFEGHDQPKVPLWGYRDESDPKEMARSIDAMANAGIGAVIFDWYRYEDNINGGVMIERALRDGFLKAPNCNRLKFALMWANHDYIDCHPFARGVSFGNAPIWRKGEVSRAAFDRITQDAIETYFKQPNYWKIDGCPYFSIYDLRRLISGLGDLAATRVALDGFRARVKAAGFPDLHINVVDFGWPQILDRIKGQPFPDDPSRKIQTIPDVLAALKVDSSTMYTWVHHLYPKLGLATSEPDLKTTKHSDSMPFGFADSSRVRRPDTKTPSEIGGEATEAALLARAAKAGVVAVDYAEYGKQAIALMDERPAALGVTYFPHVSMGWDGSPRNYSMGIVLNNTPGKWGGFLRQAKEWLDQHPESRGILTLNSWNEWVEGSYIEPDKKHGTAYLDQIRAVFRPDVKD